MFQAFLEEERERADRQSILMESVMFTLSRTGSLQDAVVSRQEEKKRATTDIGVECWLEEKKERMSKEK